MSAAITKVSSRGQIVVPADLRKDLELEEGNKLLIYTKDKTLVVKKISEPVLEKTFEEIVEPIRQKAKKGRVKESDITSAISAYRNEKR